MKVHANAPPGPKGRLTMGSKWIKRYLAEGEADCWIAPRRRTRSRTHLGGVGRSDRAAQAADDRRRDRLLFGAGALDGLSGAAAGRPRQALAPGAARAAEPLRALPRRRVVARRRQELGRIPAGRAGHRHRPSGARHAYSRDRTGTCGSRSGCSTVVRSRLRRLQLETPSARDTRRLPARLRRYLLSPERRRPRRTDGWPSRRQTAGRILDLGRAVERLAGEGVPSSGCGCRS
jgi:hypothetical protein